jgi:uncharacterized protein involved in outer membrane biogenesis
MKKILLILTAVVIVAVAGAFGYLYISLNALVKKAVETVGPKITRTDVTLGSALLLPLSGSGSLNGLVIGNPEGFGKSYALKVGSISLSVDKNTLLSDTIVINEILIKNASLTLEGTLRGNNLGKLMQNIKSYDSGSKSTTSKEKSSSSRKFIVRRVVVAGTQLNVAASALGQSVSQTLPLGDIHLENLGSDGSGISAADISQQILLPLINDAIKQGINILAKQGIKQLEQQGAGQIQNALKGLFK